MLQYLFLTKGLGDFQCNYCCSERDILLRHLHLVWLLVGDLDITFIVDERIDSL